MPDYTVRFTHLRLGMHTERVMARESSRDTIATRAGWRGLSEWRKRQTGEAQPSLDGWTHVQTVLTPADAADEE